MARTAPLIAFQGGPLTENNEIPVLNLRIKLRKMNTKRDIYYL